MKQVSGQLHCASGRTSKLMRDREHIEVAVEVPGLGRLTLSVNSAGGYSLRSCLEGEEAPAQGLLAVGVMHADEIVAVLPREAPLVEHEPS